MSELKTLNTDQWLLEGKCGDCRRKNYCKKPCTRAKRRATAILNQMRRNSESLKKLKKIKKPGEEDNKG